MSHPFTPEYIRMARAAEEIQAMRTFPAVDKPNHSNFEDGDWYLERGRDEISCLGSYEEEQQEPEAWLPLLHQLLGMLGGPMAFIQEVADVTVSEDVILNLRWERFESDWHELALAVVMREKFGKRWDGKGWVKV